MFISFEKLRFKIFLIIYGDLIFNIDLKNYYIFTQKKSECTLVVHPNNHPADSDCIQIDKYSRAKKIFFKPHVNKYIPNLCMAGINIINKKLLSL